MGIYSFLILGLGYFLIAVLYGKFTLKTAKLKLLFLVGVGLYTLLFFVLHHDIQKTCDILISNDLTWIIQTIQSWGIAAPILSIVLMILQAVIAPLPAYLITAANGVIFGLFWGVLISSIGALLGAIISFSITRWFYHQYSEKLLNSDTSRHYIDKISSQHGFKIILIARLIPILSFDLISYAAGASTIKMAPFLLATFIGMLPATIVYTAIAIKFGDIDSLPTEFIMYSLLAAVVITLFWVVKNRFRKL